MSPTAESANAAPAEAIVPERVLQDGEVILLAVKPSGWFVVLSSWPVLAAAGLVALATFTAGRAIGAAGAAPAIYLFCLGAALLRLLAACFQWLVRVYVLTDKRIMRLRGVARVDVFQCPLRQVRRTELTASGGERLFGLGSLLFDVEDADPRGSAWENLSRPTEVREAVEEAIRRARRRHGDAAMSPE